MRVSYSQLEKFDRCPACWAAEYQLGWTTPPSKAAVAGSLMHALIEQRLGAVPSFVDGFELLSKADVELAGRRADAALRVLDELGVDVVGVEVHGVGVLGDVELVGYADVIGEVDGKRVVVDWKSGRWSMKQAACYEYLWGASRFLMVGLADPVRPVVDEWDGVEFREWPVETARRLVECVHEPRKELREGWWCGFCPVVASCPAKH